MFNIKNIYKFNDDNDIFELNIDDIINNNNINNINNFGYDMTFMAKIGKIKPIYGRENEINRVIEVLCRKKKNNPILVGDAGVGKTAIVEGLAHMIANNTINNKLINKKIFNLSLTSLVSGTRYRGDFEERVDYLFKEIMKNNNIILFIDEIHMIVGSGAGSNESMDLSNMLKPYLSNSDIQIIGATTYEEYKKYIEKDSALERRFQKIVVNPLSVDETIKLLNNIKQQYEEYHNVIYTDDAIKYSVLLSDKYINNRNLPDKAIDVIDMAGSKINISKKYYSNNYIKLRKELNDILTKKNLFLIQKKYKDASELRYKEKKLIEKLKKYEYLKNKINKKHVVDIKDIVNVISSMTNVSIKTDDLNEIKKIEFLKKNIKKYLLGQDNAVENTLNNIKMNRLIFNDLNKPIVSLLFIGPHGVGKTYLAELIAKYFFDSEKNIIKIDMSEVYDMYSVTKIINEYLINSIYKKPHCVVLFDKIDKCDKNILNIFLQLIEDGYLTDLYGKKISFKNTILIFISDITTDDNSIGFIRQKDNIKNDTKDNNIFNILKNHFSEDFLNKLDDIIQFNKLDEKIIIKIINNEMKEIIERFKKNNYIIKYTNDLLYKILKDGYNKNIGIGSIKHYIKRNIINLILNNINYNDNKNIIKIKYNKNKDEIYIDL